VPAPGRRRPSRATPHSLRLAHNPKERESSRASGSKGRAWWAGQTPVTAGRRRTRVGRCRQGPAARVRRPVGATRSRGLEARVLGSTRGLIECGHGGFRFQESEFCIQFNPFTGPLAWRRGGFLFLLFIVNFDELLIIDYSLFRLNPI